MNFVTHASASTVYDWEERRYIYWDCMEKRRYGIGWIQDEAIMLPFSTNAQRASQIASVQLANCTKPQNIQSRQESVGTIHVEVDNS